ncbi:DUF2231 domain-containing protein [Nitrosomonas sp. HPC101]|uniref:DUF2231 domain-containing protein n=1 Tax=Nitrosomonas sp. HPC101 TaxID=1658667 RepID=UPI00136F2DDB|nr:DUF2231 domain-containing protein [Nitrosomonas sp. HPC101]MXS85778.1 DUF2231 domain-containing protein [Nitrosomonas sp. HPC101]
MRHPVHPMLVHFPIATWFISTLCDIAGLLTTNELVSWVAGVLLVIGTITALLAMVAGLMELAKIDQQSPAMKIANQHMLLMMTSWLLYAVSLFLRLDGTQLGQPGLVAIVLSVAGLITLCIAGWLGGRLVYEYGVGTYSSRS